MTPIGPAFIGWSCTSTAPLPAMVSTTGMPWRSAKAASAVFGAAVAHAAAGDDQRLLGRLAAARPRPRASVAVGPRPRDAVDGRLEEPLGIVERLRLHVLAQADERRAAIGRVEHVATAWGSDADDLLRPGDPVPVARHGLEGVVDADRRVAEVLDLLQHRVGQRLTKVSPDEQQDRQAVGCATPAAVTMLVAPGPIELVATMICRRRLALAKATAASAIDCSFWPRQVGSSSLTASSASRRQVTLPWPKIANTPGNSGSFSPSITVCWLPDSAPGPAPWYSGSLTFCTSPHRAVQCGPDDVTHSRRYAFFIAENSNLQCLLRFLPHFGWRLIEGEREEPAPRRLPPAPSFLM